MYDGTLPARILVLDDEATLSKLAADILAGAGFEPTEANLPSEALALGAAENFDLVVSDVNLPEMNGFRFRERFRAIPGRERTPFVFVSAADAQVERDIARLLGPDKLLLKPFRAADLRRTVQTLLEVVESVRGDIPAAFDRILLDLERGKGSGILTAARGTMLKRVAVQDGNVVFALSNDPRDLMGQALLRTGRVSEADLREAFARGAPSAGGPFLETALAAMRKVSPEQSRQVFASRIRELVLDLFLWRGGAVEFMGGAVEPEEQPYPVSFPVASIRAEGLRRRERWDTISRVLPNPNASFERRGDAWPAGFPATPGDKVLAGLVEQGLSLGEILFELRGQDFAVCAKLAALLQSGVLKVAGEPGYITREIERLLAKADETFEIVDDPDSEIGDTTMDILVRTDTHARSAEPEERPPARPSTDEVATRVVPDPKPSPETAAPAPPAALPAPVRPAPRFASPPPPPGPVGFTGGPPPPPPPAGAPPPPPGATPPPRAVQRRPVAAEQAFLQLLRRHSPSVPAGEPATLLEEGLQHFRAGEFRRARELFAATLEHEPLNTLARERLGACDAALAREARASGLDDGRTVALATSVDELQGLQIAPSEGFVLTRFLAGPMKVQDLLLVCPMTESEVLSVLRRLVDDGILRLED